MDDVRLLAETTTFNAGLALQHALAPSTMKLQTGSMPSAAAFPAQLAGSQGFLHPASSQAAPAVDHRTASPRGMHQDTLVWF